MTTVLASAKGTIWIGTDGEGLLALDQQAKKVRRFRHAADDPKSLTDDHVTVLFEDKNGVLWIGTPNGLNRMEGDTLVQYQHDQNDPSDPTRLSFPAVESIYQDTGGVMWVGGFTVGVCKFDEYRTAFGHYKTRTHANSFFEDPDGSVWVGTYNGLYHYEWKNQRVTLYRSLGKLIGEGDPVSLESTWVTTIHRDRRASCGSRSCGAASSRSIRRPRRIAATSPTRRSQTVSPSTPSSISTRTSSGGCGSAPGAVVSCGSTPRPRRSPRSRPRATRPAAPA